MAKSTSLVSSFKIQDQRMNPTDNLSAVLKTIFPTTELSGHTNVGKSNEVLKFTNLQQHLKSVLVNLKETKPEYISVFENKASSSSGASSSKSPRPNYLKGIFGEKKLDPREFEKDKLQDFEIEHRIGRLGPALVSLQSHPLDTAPADPLTVVGNMNFQSVKATCCVYKGKWMYEAVLGSSGLMQIGWCTTTCKFTREEGVGDTANSYAFDGYREAKWNSRENAKYGETWTANDIVTCLLDLDNRTVSFCLNGKNMGIAFSNIPTGPGIAYFPAFSVAYKEVLQVNFGNHAVKHQYPGYRAIQNPPDALSNAMYLVNSLETLFKLKQENSALTECLDPVTECLIASHIFCWLSPALSESFVMEAALLPFLYELSSSGVHQVLNYIWSFLEEIKAQECIDFILSTVCRQYKTCPIEPSFDKQRKYLTFVLDLIKHSKTKTHLLEHTFADKRDELPYLFHIKQPSHACVLLDDFTHEDLKERLTAVEDIQRDILRALLENDGKYSEKCCKLFAEKIRNLFQNYVSTTREQSALCPPLVMHSFMQRITDVIRQMWDTLTVIRGNYIPSDEGYMPPELFYTGIVNYYDTQRAGGLTSHLLQEHKDLLDKEGVSVTMGSRSGNSDSWREDHRAFMQLIDNDPGTSLSTLVTGDEDTEMETYNPVIRLARALLQHSTKVSSTSASLSVSRKRLCGDEDLWLPTCIHLLALTDSCIMLYTQSIHQQMDKICSTRTKLNEFTSSLEDTEKKLNKCTDKQFDEIKASIEQSKSLLEKHVSEMQRSMEWLKAASYAPESQHNLWWLLQVCLRTIERMSKKGALFAFIPEFYITCATRIFKCLREYFSPTQPIDILPNLHSVLIRFALFLSHHHSDGRIINTDVKTLLATTLASFVTHPLQLKAIESLSKEEQKSLLRSMLTAYDEDKPWTSMGHRILAGMWRGKGFAQSYDHLPYLAKVKRLLNRDKGYELSDTWGVRIKLNLAGINCAYDYPIIILSGKAVIDPYVSALLLDELCVIMVEDSKLASDFVHSIINHLNWCFSEFIGQLQEVHLQGSKASSAGGLLSALDAQSLRQVRIVDMLFEISVSLLRVLELTISLAPAVYLDWDKHDKAEILLTSLVQIVNQILNRVTKKHNIFDRVLSSKHPGLRSVVHYPLLVAITGVIVALLREHRISSWTKRAVSALIRDPGFNIVSIDMLLKEDPFPGTSSGDKPSTSTSVPEVRKKTTEGFSLYHREEVSEKELKHSKDAIDRLHKWLDVLEKEEPMDEESLCTICYANEITVKFKPCMHTSCKSCISHQMMNSKECFFCKTKVECYVPIQNTN